MRTFLMQALLLPLTFHSKEWQLSRLYYTCLYTRLIVNYLRIVFQIPDPAINSP